jgi:hypothetical protein
MSIHVGITLSTLAIHCPCWQYTLPPWHYAVHIGSPLIGSPLSTLAVHTLHVGGTLSTLAVHCPHWQSSVHVGNVGITLSTLAIHCQRWQCTLSALAIHFPHCQSMVHVGNPLSTSTLAVHILHVGSTHSPHWHYSVHIGCTHSPTLSTLAVNHSRKQWTAYVGSMHCPYRRYTVHIGSTVLTLDYCPRWQNTLSTLALHCPHWQSTIQYTLSKLAAHTLHVRIPPSTLVVHCLCHS